MKKRILYIWKSHYPFEVRIEKICKSLADYGCDVFVLAKWSGETKADEDYLNHHVIRVGAKGSKAFNLPVSLNPVWRKAIKYAIEKIKPDLVIVREIMLASAAAFYAHKAGIPIIMDMAENYPGAMREWKKYNDSAIPKFLVHKLKLPDLVEKKSISRMDGIITVCHEQNERLHEQYAYEKRNVAVVHNTPLLHRTSSIPKSPSEQISFGHHGFLTAEKRIDSLFKAFAIVKKSMNEAQLLIAGRGECFEEYQNLVDNLNIKDSVDFIGDYNFKDLPAILSSIDIGVLPYPENDFNNFTIHNKIFDYFSAGIPVIVSESEPMKRVIEETGAGLSVKSDDIDGLAKAMTFMAEQKRFEGGKFKSYSSNAINSHIYKYNWEFDAVNLISFINRYLNA